MRIAPLLGLAALLAAAPASAQNGPSNYWHLDQGGTVAADAAGKNPGTIAGAASVKAVVNKGLLFDGVDDSVTFQRTFPFHAAGNQTLMLWVRWTDDAHRALLWSRDGNGGPDADRFHLFTGDLGTLSCDGGAGLGLDYREADGNLHRLLCVPGLPAGAWYHVAVTRRAVPVSVTDPNAGQQHVYTMYVNGLPAAEAVDAAPALPTYQGAWVLGTRDGFMWSGTMDEVALYPRALSAAEVAAKYKRSAKGLRYEADAPATCTAWDLASNFRVPPGQANPSADACGNAVWSYLGAPAGSRDPAAFSLLTAFSQGWSNYDGLVSWNCGADCFPTVNYNGSGGSAFTPWWAPFEWAADQALVHPGPDASAVAAFRAPLAGTVSVEQVTTDADPYCGDGVDWAFLAGTTVLASGVATSGAPVSFAGTVAVVAGDRLFAVVGPNGPGDHYCDSTQVSFKVRQVSVTARLDVVPGAGNQVSRALKFQAAVLAAPGFDVAGIEPASVYVAGLRATAVGTKDVNGDGLPDLVATFPAPTALPLGTQTVALSALLRDGTKVTGQDVVKVVR